MEYLIDFVIFVLLLFGLAWSCKDSDLDEEGFGR